MSSPIPTPTALQLQQAIGGLTDPEEIGRGGFAVVYRARQPALGRSVAVKVLVHSVRRPDERARFEREAHAMGLLSGHPGIVQLYAAGVLADGRPFLLMEDMGGGSLDEALRRRRLTVDEATALGIRLAGALGAAHDVGLVHCDVTPRNVLASRFGEWRLGDFGIARLIEGTAAPPEAFCGSLAYAAPEVFRGEPTTRATDVFGLGATLYDAIAGPGRAPGAAPPPPIDEVPDRLNAVVLTALAPDPRHRWRTPRHLAMALNRVRRDAGLPQEPLGATRRGGATTRPPRAPESEAAAPKATPRRALALLGGVALIAAGLGGGLAMSPLVLGEGDNEPTATESGTSTTPAESAAPEDGPAATAPDPQPVPAVGEPAPEPPPAAGTAPPPPPGGRDGAPPDQRGEGRARRDGREGERS